MNIKGLYIYLFFIFFYSSFAQNQIKISGSIINDTNEKLENANVILKNEKTFSIISYSTSDSEGYFYFSINTTETKIKIIISRLGYETVSKDIEITSDIINLDSIKLIKNTLELKEIIIESQKKAIVVKGDTTIYNVNRFLNGTEDSLKDLLKNLPGMRINSNGKIEVNGRVISELLIDGDNLYKSQHQLATENLSSKIVKSIEYYKNYTSFDKVKMDSISNDTALNIIIKDEYKKKIKGHLSVENNFDNRYKVNSTVYNLNEKNKFSLIQNWNNIGDVPISIIDYFSLVGNEESETNDGSSVTFKSFEVIPKFLRTGENVAMKNNSFFNISNIYIPNKKTKIHFYSLFNTSSQNEIFNNTLKYIDSNLNISENNNSNEKNLFAVFNLKSVFKPNDKTLFKITNYVLIDNINNFDNIESIINTNTSSVNQKNENNTKKFENNFIFSKKFKNSNLYNTMFFNVENVRSASGINSTSPFLNLNFSNNYVFSQKFDKTVANFGAESQYGIKIKKFTTGLKLGYSGKSYDYKNSSETTIDYKNEYKSREYFLTQGINSNLTLSKKMIFSFAINNNFVLQAVNSSQLIKTSFFGYNLNTKISFSHNSILQINNSYSNTLSNPDNLIENEYIKDYRTILRNLNLKPNTLFPLNNLSINYLKTNPETNTFLIINLNHSWSDKSENSNVINENNYSVFENAISTKNEFSDFVFFYEKNLQNVPFIITYNIDMKYTFKKFFINEELSFYKSTYISNSFNIRSKFKKSPIHFDLGYNYSTSDYNNNNTISNNRVIQFFSNINGLFLKNFYWKASYSFNNFIVNNNPNLVTILSASLRYSKQNSNWEYTINMHNVLNFNNPIFVTNQSGAGYESQVSNLNLPGYITLGLKYKF
jgi:hypothetical protein